jgi:uncharacterized protein YggE
MTVEDGSVGKRGVGSIGKRGIAAALAMVIGLSSATGALAQSTSAQTATPAAVAGNASGQATIVVSGFGTASAPASGAIVQLIARQLGVADITSPGAADSEAPVLTGSPTPPTKDQVKSVTDALVKAGVAKDGVMTTITPTGPFYGAFGPGTAVIAFQLTGDQVKKTTKFIQTALKQGEEAGVAFDAINAVYTVTDCAAVANQALTAAIADGRAQAEAMAPALHAQLGDLVQAVSQSSFGKYYGGGGPNYCSQPVTLESALHSYFSSFDAGANVEVEISATVSLTYAIS